MVKGDTGYVGNKYRICRMNNSVANRYSRDVNGDIVAFLRSLSSEARDLEVQKIVSGWLSYQSRFGVGEYSFGGPTVVIVALFFGHVLMVDEGGNRVGLKVRPSAVGLERDFIRVPIRAGTVLFCVTYRDREWV